MQAQPDFNQPIFGHGASETVLHPLVAVALLISIVLMLWRPRKYVVVPLLLCTFLVPRGQVILLAGTHIYVRLILLFVGFIRVLKDKFRIAGGFNSVDKLFIVWVCYRVFATVVTNWPAATMEQMAFLLQAICGYFLLRYAIQNEEDVARTAKTLAFIALVLSLCMVYEHYSLINPFGTYLGGTDPTPIIRNGTGRAQATFGHSILAGCFGATLLPLFIWLWKKKARVSAVAGTLGSTLIVLTAVSSTPVMAYGAGILGLLLWPVRRSMKALRWGIVFTIVALAIVMNAPVWFVISHIDVIGGSGGYDRAFLIDTCVRHFKDWWLIGTKQNGGWGWDMWDLSNQFVAEAEMGGILSLICFISIIAKCFGRLGTMRKRVKPEQQWLSWCLGSVMLAHIFAYFGVAYWDQTQIWWFSLLAMICAVTIPHKPSRLRQTAPAASAWVMFSELGKTAPAVSTGDVPALVKCIRPWRGPML